MCKKFAGGNNSKSLLDTTKNRLCLNIILLIEYPNCYQWYIIALRPRFCSNLKSINMFAWLLPFFREMVLDKGCIHATTKS